MRDLYSDDFASVAAEGADRLIPEGVRRITGALVFLGVIVVMGLWAWRLGTRDASEVPIIRAMEGPARIQPDDPGGLQAAHQGLEVNAVLGGAPESPSRSAEIPPARPAPAPLAAEDAAQGELVASAPQALAEKVLGQVSGELTAPDEGAAGEETAALQPILPPDATDEDEGTLGGPGATLDGTDTDTAAAVRPRNRPAGLVRPKPTAGPVATAATGAAATATVVAAIDSAAAKPAVTPQPVPTKAASPVATNEVSSVKPGARLVQLGAFDSEDITRKAWSALVSKNPDLLSSKSLYVERTTSNARVFYRLRVAGFQSAEDTRQMCEALRGRGVACIPVTLQ